MKLLILLSFFISAFSWANEITFPKGVPVQSNFTLDCGVHGRKKITANLEVNNWAEGKIRVAILAEGRHFSDEGPGYYSDSFSLHYVGIENGLGSYDLFDNGDFIKRVGEIVFFGEKASVKFDQTLKGATSTSLTKCEIHKETSLFFDVTKPSCFNKRGKEISCPEIKFL